MGNPTNEATKTSEQRLADERFEEWLEAAYWDFDNRKKRHLRPMSERDAFKAAVRRFAAEIRTQTQT